MNRLVTAPLEFCADRRFAGAENAFDPIISDAHSKATVPAGAMRLRFCR
jgi:hypothetical protein